MLEVFNRSAYVEKQSTPKLRHGRFTSPHLIDRWDCISINGEPVTGEVFRAVESQVLKRDRQQKIGASEFEVLTATAFEIFNREKIDVGVVEVGMGGAEDATNVIGQPVITGPGFGAQVGNERLTRRAPLVTVISKIGLDHQSFLGDTLEAIARQKAGVIKPGVPVVVDPSNAPEALDVIESTAREKNCPFFGSNIGSHPLAANLNPTGSSSGPSITQRLNDVLLQANSGSVPEHVKQNGALAFIATNLALQALGHPNPDMPNPRLIKNEYLNLLSELQEQFLKAIPATVFPGRQQWTSCETLTGRKTPILLDGAHNADSAGALGEKVDQLRRSTGSTEEGVTWVLAASESKDAKEIFRPLLKPQDSAFVVEFGPVDGMPWVKPMSLDKLEEAIASVLGEATPGSSMVAIQRDKDVLHAMKQATAMARDTNTEKDGLLVVAGSLYLAGDVLRLVRDAG